MSSSEGCSKSCWGNVCAGLATVPVSIFAGVMIWIGSANIPQEESCPSAPQLPVLLIVGGVIIVLWFSIRPSVEKVCGCCEGLFDSCKTGGKLLKCGMKVFYDSCFIMATSIWWIIALVYTSNNIPNTNEDGVFVCSDKVHNMTLVSLVAIGFLLAFAIIFFVIGRICCNVFCCKACSDSTEGTVNA